MVKPAEDVLIEDLGALGSDFRIYLKGRKYSKNTARTYSNHAAILLRKAKDLGWVLREPEIPEAGKPVVEAFERAALRPSKELVAYAIAKAKTTVDFTDDDLTAWREMMIGKGRNCDYVDELRRRFRFGVLHAGLASMFPGLTCEGHTEYAIPLSMFPDRLRAEVQALLKWKQDAFAPGRPRRGRHRPVTTKNLTALLTRLYAFVLNVQGRRPESVLELVTESSMVSYVTWALNERKVEGTPLVGSFFGYLRQNDSSTTCNTGSRRAADQLPIGASLASKESARMPHQAIRK